LGADDSSTLGETSQMKRYRNGSAIIELNDTFYQAYFVQISVFKTIFIMQSALLIQIR